MLSTDGHPCNLDLELTYLEFLNLKLTRVEFLWGKFSLLKIHHDFSLSENECCRFSAITLASKNGVTDRV